VHRSGVAAALRRSSRTAVDSAVTGPPATVLPEDALPTEALPEDALPEDALQWSWPPYAPVHTESAAFDTDDWAPPSVVWHPQLRVGRWTMLYRRSGS
jgi:hypothetical protein